MKDYIIKITNITSTFLYRFLNRTFFLRSSVCQPSESWKGMHNKVNFSVLIHRVSDTINQEIFNWNCLIFKKT